MHGHKLWYAQLYHNNNESMLPYIYGDMSFQKLVDSTLIFFDKLHNNFDNFCLYNIMIEITFKTKGLDIIHHPAASYNICS